MYIHTFCIVCNLYFMYVLYYIVLHSTNLSCNVISPQARCCPTKQASPFLSQNPLVLLIVRRPPRSQSGFDFSLGVCLVAPCIMGWVFRFQSLRGLSESAAALTICSTHGV